MESWSASKAVYQINEEVSLVKACSKEFSIYESVYGDGIYNKFAVKHWNLRLAVSMDTPFAKNESFYWIVVDDKRVGGVLIEPNVIARLFTIPPFADSYKVVKLLKKVLLEWSDPSEKIVAYQVDKDQALYFEMLGFWLEKRRRWMMRPTESLNFNWDEGFKVKKPEKSQIKEIAELLGRSFKNGVDLEGQLTKGNIENNYEMYMEEVVDFFEDPSSVVLEASTIIYDAKTEKIVGVCLVSIFEEWPLIHTIGIHPSYVGKGLGKAMLSKAISSLNKEYPVVRLFVTIGNDAEAVYHELGFVQGVEFRKYYLPQVK